MLAFHYNPWYSYFNAAMQQHFDQMVKLGLRYHFNYWK